MRIIHGSSRRLALALRRAGPFFRLRRGLKRFTSEVIRWNVNPRYEFDWNEDIFLAYPDQRFVHNAPAEYAAMKEFYNGNKYTQWQTLREFFRTPEFEEPPYVRRPLRHEGGIDFHITNTRPPADHDSRYYWRSLFERSCEYRVFFVKGRKVLTLLKQVPDGTSQQVAWNHGVSSFVTVHDPENDRLRHSRFYEKAADFFRALPFHLAAVDVLYRQQRHRVVEVNFSPGVLIPDNLRTLTSALLSNDRSNTNSAAAQAALR